MDTLDQSPFPFLVPPVVPMIFVTPWARVAQLSVRAGMLPVVSLLPVIVILALIVSDHHLQKKKRNREQREDRRSGSDDTSEG